MKIGLIGATNVGKSTLFNRLIGQFRAIVTDIPWTTTDIIKHKLQLDNGEMMTFFDSPWLLDFTDELPYINQIVKESDFLLFLIDDSVGVTAKEQHILKLIRDEKRQDQTLLIINKLDLRRKESETDLAIADYYDLGIPNIIGISAKTERNLSEVEDQLLKKYHQWKKIHPEGIEEAEETRIGLAIVGKPNAWKSTLLNTLVGSELAKVADVAGTTRDYVSGDFEWGKKKFTAYDTAGIKKRGSIHGIEKIAYDKTKAMLEYTRPVVIFMVDCTQGVTHRDMTLLQEIHSLALPIIFALNKVDQVNPKGLEAMIRGAQSYLEFAKYIPIVPMVATKGQGIQEVMKMVGMLQKENTKRVWTRELNKAIWHEMIQRPPRFPKNKIAKILYATQIAVDAPTFIMFVNHKSRVNFAFKKRVENTIRKHFGFIGVPIVIKYRNRGESWMERDIQVNFDEHEAKEYGGDEGDEAEVGTSHWTRENRSKRRDGSPRPAQAAGLNRSKKLNRPNPTEEESSRRPESNNPYNNKGKRKRDKTTEEKTRTTRRGNEIKSEPKGKDEPRNPSRNESRRDASIKRPNNEKPKSTEDRRFSKKPKRESKYSNTKKGSQGKISEMFSKVYGEKNKDKNRKVNKRRSATK